MTESNYAGHDISQYFSGKRRATFQCCRLLPGRHKFVMEAPGWRSVEKIVEVKAGEGERVEVELTKTDPQ